MKGKVTELETNITNKNIRRFCRGINDIKQSQQTRTNTEKDEKVDLVADSHSLLPRWRNYFFQLLNVHGVNDLRRTEIQTAKPPVPEPGVSEFEMAIEKLNRHKSLGTDQIPAELINKLYNSIWKLCNSIWNREEMPEQWKEYLFTRQVMKETVVIIKAYHFYQLHTIFIQHPAVNVKSTCTGNWG
jgi:hypothetical protein